MEETNLRVRPENQMTDGSGKIIGARAGQPLPFERIPPPLRAGDLAAAGAGQRVNKPPFAGNLPDWISSQ